MVRGMSIACREAPIAAARPFGGCFFAGIRQLSSDFLCVAHKIPSAFFAVSTLRAGGEGPQLLLGKGDAAFVFFYLYIA